MEKYLINVPEDVRYISNWEGFSLPDHPSIINKTVTGCGFTEYCLRNNRATILCSPRKVLLENKYEQHLSEDEWNFYIVRNTGEKRISLDISLERDSTQTLAKVMDEDNAITEDQGFIFRLIEDLRRHISQCISQGLPPKILVTYDSFKHVLKAIQSFSGTIQDSFDIVVDEFQSIFIDSRFKPTVEMDFLNYLSGLKRVYFLSATPVMEKYLSQMDEFKDLPYYEFIWPESVITKPKIARKKVKSIVTPIVEIIKDYLGGNFPTKATSDGVIHESREVVFFVNSVRTITEVIKRSGLSGRSDLVNILCSSDSRNSKKLKEVKLDIGKLPLVGDHHKMFTFCTRTVYLGADFYSTNATTVIASDCNISSLSVDISLDLPQIMGRQRLGENVFKDEAKLFYKLSRLDIPYEEFESYVNKKSEGTRLVLSGFSKLNDNEKIKNIDDRRKLVKSYRYNDDYAGVSERDGIICFNKLVQLSELRAWEVSQVNYKDDISMINELHSKGYIVENQDKPMIDRANEFLMEFSKKTYDFREAYKYLCESELDQEILNYVSKRISQDYINYYYVIGAEKSRSLGYQRSNLEREYNNYRRSGDVQNVIISEFQVSQRYTLKEIKEKLGIIYQNLGITKTPKALDLEEYFNVKKTKVTTKCGIRENGLEIIKIKFI